jgi:hypothetical protein
MSASGDSARVISLEKSSAFIKGGSYKTFFEIPVSL